MLHVFASNAILSNDCKYPLHSLLLTPTFLDQISLPSFISCWVPMWLHHRSPWVPSPKSCVFPQTAPASYALSWLMMQLVSSHSGRKYRRESSPLPFHSTANDHSPNLNKYVTLTNMSPIYSFLSSTSNAVLVKGLVMSRFDRHQCWLTASLLWGLVHTANISMFPLVTFLLTILSGLLITYGISRDFLVCSEGLSDRALLIFPFSFPALSLCMLCSEPIPCNANTSHLPHGCSRQFSCLVYLPSPAICRVLEDPMQMSYPLWSLPCLSGQKQNQSSLFLSHHCTQYDHDGTDFNCNDMLKCLSPLIDSESSFRAGIALFLFLQLSAQCAMQS